MFSIGQSNPPIQRQRRRDQRQRQQSLSTTSDRQQRRVMAEPLLRRVLSPNTSKSIEIPFNLSSTYTPSPQWFLLPESETSQPSLYRDMMNLKTYGFNAAFDTYLKLKGETSPFVCYTRPYKQEDAFTFKITTESNFLKKSPAYLAEYKRLLYKNQQVRWAFKRLVTRWLRSRMVAANTEDPVTMEVPKQCVTLYDWDARKKYIFEAATIYRDILEKLFYCSGLFPSSMHPRNPYTNENMTIGQDIHCVQQLHAFGFRSWAIEAYRAAQFNLDSFMAMHARAIKGEALYRAFKHKTTEYEELLFDFIEDEYERHSVDIPVYKELSWAICEAPNLRILQQWSELCYTYYRDLFRSPDEQSAEILKKMKARSALLVEASLQPILEEYKKRGPKPLTTTPVQQETFTFNFDELVSLLTEL